MLSTADVFPRAFEFGLRADPIMHLKPGTKFYWHVVVFHQDIFWEGIQHHPNMLPWGYLKEELKSWSSIFGFHWFDSKTWPRFPWLKSEGWFHGLPKRGSCSALPCLPAGGPDGKLGKLGPKGCWCDGFGSCVATCVLIWLQQLAAEDAAMSHSRLFLEPWGTSPSTDKVLFNLAWINARTLRYLFNLSLQFACLENDTPSSFLYKMRG